MHKLRARSLVVLQQSGLEQAVPVAYERFSNNALNKARHGIDLCTSCWMTTKRRWSARERILAPDKMLQSRAKALMKALRRPSYLPKQRYPETNKMQSKGRVVGEEGGALKVGALCCADEHDVVDCVA